MTVYLLAVFFMFITPGPGVLSAAGVSAAYGRDSALRYIAGLCLGNNLVGLAVVSGLAAIVLSYAPMRIVLIAASTAYLAYLAAKIAFAGARVAFIHPETPPGFRDAVALQIINPKAYAANTFLYTSFPFLPGNLALELTIKFVIINAIWIPVHLAWMAAGAYVRSLDLPARTQRVINIGMAVALMVVVGLAILAQFAPAGAMALAVPKPA